MNSFTDTVRKHGLIVWLCHVLASLIVYGVTILLLMAGLLTVVGIGVSSFFSAALTPEALMNSLKSLSPWALGGTAFFVGIVALLAYALAYSFGQAGEVAVTADAVARDTATFKTFFTQGFKNMWRMLGLWVVSYLLYIPVMLLMAGVAYLFTVNSPGLAVLTSVLTLALFLFTGLGLLFSQYILIAERETIWRSITASFGLLRRETGNVVVTFLILFGIGAAFLIPSMAMWGGRGTLFHPAYSLIVTPIIATLVTLTVTYRYYRYMRPELYPTATQEDVVERRDDVDNEMDKTEY